MLNLVLPPAFYTRAANQFLDGHSLADASMELDEIGIKENKVMEITTPTISGVSDIHTAAAIAGNNETHVYMRNIAEKGFLAQPPSLMTH